MSITELEHRQYRSNQMCLSQQQRQTSFSWRASRRSRNRERQCSSGIWAYLQPVVRSHYSTTFSGSLLSGRRLSESNCRTTSRRGRSHSQTLRDMLESWNWENWACFVIDSVMLVVVIVIDEVEVTKGSRYHSRTVLNKEGYPNRQIRSR